MTYQINQVVRVEIGDDNVAGSNKGARRWVLGTVTAVSLRAGEYGNLVSVNIFPEKEGNNELVKRYDGASRIEAGSMEDAQHLAEARDAAGVKPSLTTQKLTNNERAFEDKCARIQSVNLRSNTSGKGAHSTLTDERLGAIFQHPQVIEQLSTLVHQAGRHFQQQLTEALEALELAKTSLKSCDHERRQLLQSEAQLQGKVARLEQLRDKPKGVPLTAQQLMAGAGKMSGRGFILWQPGSNMPVTITYETYKKAEEIRAVMAKRHPNKVFHICAVGEGLVERVIPATRQVEFV
ncbi:hypothetical protein Luke3_00009 [Pseudomonas phage vB_PpuP-Luke-3]